MGEIEILKSLADESRLSIIKFLMNGEKCVCEIFPYINKTQSTTSSHLINLENAGLVKSRRNGKFIYYTLANKNLIKIVKLLEDNQ